jgi:hypothetical protein
LLIIVIVRPGDVLLEIGRGPFLKWKIVEGSTWAILVGEVQWCVMGDERIGRGA